jgi:hypothetical protein
MVHVSQTVNKKAKNYKKEFTPEEQSLLPFLPEFLADSFKKGIEEGKAKTLKEILLPYMTKNPMLSDKQIAEIFEIEVSLVKQLRKEVK